MAEAAIGLLSDPARLKRFQVQARERAVRSFNADRIIPEYEAFYEEILGQA
jgi:glycosyltransferase involved in cell wall biosynthesis